MKIGIITQPLRGNYGGILQNYALQQVLIQLGHEPITLRWGRQPLWDWVKGSLKCLLRGRCPIPRAISKLRPFAGMLQFIESHIRASREECLPRRRDVRRYQLEAIIVGSDQVWRPMYNLSIESMFLQFTVGMDLRRIAYAASFGTAEWEFTAEQAAVCRQLIQRFDAVSVREQSGVALCADHLNYQHAQWVLDPTFLLTADDYAKLCLEFPQRGSFVFAYLLDITPDKQAYVRSVADSMGLKTVIMEAEKEIKPEDTPIRWLAGFRDAAFIITDSFHGTVFAINFHKEFLTFTNVERGSARFDSLIEIFGVGHRIVSEVPASGADNLIPIDWALVDERLKEWREKSRAFLIEGLTGAKTKH